MDVKAINAGVVSTPQKDEKHQATIQRVQAEFINQLCKGKSETEAFRSSLKAIDEKYNPKEDEFKAEMHETVGCTLEHCNVAKLGSVHNVMKSVKLPNGKTILKWLNFIAEALPIILQIIDRIPKQEPKPAENLHQVA